MKYKDIKEEFEKLKGQTGCCQVCGLHEKKLKELLDSNTKRVKKETVEKLEKEKKKEKTIVFWKTKLEGVGEYQPSEDEDSVTITIKEMKDIWGKAINQAIKAIK